MAFGNITENSFFGCGKFFNPLSIYYLDYTCLNRYSLS